MINEKLQKVATVLRSSLFLDAYGILLFGYYAVPGFFKYAQTASLAPSFVFCLDITLAAWAIQAAFKKATYDDFSFIKSAKKLPGAFLFCFVLVGYVLNYQYSNQDIYVYSVPFIAYSIMVVCALISRKIYNHRLNKATVG